MRCQVKILEDSRASWGKLISEWLLEEKNFINATYFQNEMIYVDFFAGGS